MMIAFGSLRELLQKTNFRIIGQSYLTSHKNSGKDSKIQLGIK